MDNPADCPDPIKIWNGAGIGYVYPILSCASTRAIRSNDYDMDILAATILEKDIYL